MSTMANKVLIEESACRLEQQTDGRFTARNKDGSFSSSRNVDFIIGKAPEDCLKRYNYRALMEGAEEPAETPAPPEEEAPPAEEEPVAELVVIVSDERNNPLNNALVTFQGIEQRTGVDGRTTFTTRNLEDLRVRVAAEGYRNQSTNARLVLGDRSVSSFRMELSEAPPEEEPTPEPEAPPAPGRDYVAELLELAQAGKFLEAGQVAFDGLNAASDALVQYVNESFGIDLPARITPEEMALGIVLLAYPVGKGGKGVAAAESAVKTLSREAPELSIAAVSKRFGISKEEIIRRFGDVIAVAQKQGASKAVLDEAIRKIITRESDALLADPAITGIRGLIEGLQKIAKPLLGLIALGGTVLGVGFLAPFLQEEGIQGISFSTRDLLQRLTFETDPEIRRKLIEQIKSNLGIFENTLNSLSAAIAGAGQLNPFTSGGYTQFRDDSAATLEGYKQALAIEEAKTPAPGEEVPEEEKTGIEFTANQSPFELVVGQFMATVVSPYFLEAPAGSYSWVARREGFYERSGTAIVKDGVKSAVTITFQALPGEVPANEGNVTYSAIDGETGETLFVDWFVNNELVKASSSFLTIIMAPKEVFTVVARKEGYNDATDTYTLNAGANPSQTLRLSRIPEEEIPEAEGKARISIKSTPTQAKIYVDDEYTFEQTDTTILVVPGRRKITLKKAGYRDISQTVELAAGQEIELTLVLPIIPEPVPEPTPEPATVKAYLVTYITQPKGVSIYVNGENTFKITDGSILLFPGTYTVTLRKFGYSDFIDELNLEEF